MQAMMIGVMVAMCATTGDAHDGAEQTDAH